MLKRGACRTLLVTCLLSAAIGASAQDGAAQKAELKPCPPPEGACAEDVVTHVLTETVGTWKRSDTPVVGDPALVLDLSADVQDLLAVYEPVCSASAQYRDTAGEASGTATMIAFGSTIDSLGFFAAQRTEAAKRVLLTSAGYRDQGILHVYSGWYYLRVEVVGAEKEALPPDQYIAARLEVRLPAREESPRIIRVMPRGWVNALTVSYEATDLLGEDLRPMAAGATKMVGAAHMRLRLMRAADHAEAGRWYTRLLQRSLARGRAWEAPNLGQDGFYAANGGAAVGMLQDEFVAHLKTDGGRADAEAIMRLVGTAIRITRPLPGDADGVCAPQPSPAP